MECNKEEATRARDSAVTKMQTNDFSGGQKLALRARQIYPDLENIIHLLTVCDIHCASQKKIDSLEMDWYGILQVEQTGDDTLIKKQYRKLALLLHPDKNSFPGAEAAFKLIGEAQRVLLDPVKRRMHDMKRRTSVKPSAVRVPHVARQPVVPKNSRSHPVPQYTNVHLQKKSQSPAQQGFSSNTFITACHFCHVRGHISISDKYKSVSCHSCKKYFIALDIASQNFAPEKSDAKAAFVQMGIPSQVKTDTSRKFEGNVRSENSHANLSKKTASSKGVKESGRESIPKQVNNKRKRTKSEEFFESSDSESSADTDESTEFVVNDELETDHGIGTNINQNRRRSAREKQKVSYNESLSDDDELSVPSMGANVGSPSGRVSELNHGKTEPLNNSSRNQRNGTQKLKRREPPAKTNGEVNPSIALKPDSFSYPDPEFNNFDNIRKAECFKIGQIWALYDEFGALPRFYGRVEILYPKTNMLRLTWLEWDGDNEVTPKWVHKKLPKSCGKFSSGRSQLMDIDGGMFSHEVCWEKEGDNFYVYPQKGQTWALFKNWNIEWSLESSSNKTYEYEFAEVLSDYSDGHGVKISYMGKVQGFASIFCRNDKGKTFHIPPDEVFRFSHRIPSFQLTGKEKEGIPTDAFELDPASLPIPIKHEVVADHKQARALPRKFKDINGGTLPSVDKCSVIGTGNSFSDHKSEDPNNGDSSRNGESIEVPDPEFFAFESSWPNSKFAVGQIWAVYSGDGLPKYYAQIERISSSPEFELFIKWLNFSQTQGDMIKWHDEEMPYGCGIFNLSRAKPEVFSPGTFSHKLNPRSTGKKHEYVIFPKKGEVWALYKDWNPNMKFSEIEDYEYEIAEVMNIDSLTVEVMPLHCMKEHVSLFRAQANTAIRLIPKQEILRFSHQIPSFRLTDEANGTLRNCLELDPAAVPPILLAS